MTVGKAKGSNCVLEPIHCVRVERIEGCKK